MPTWPVPSASSVGGDIQLRTTFAVPSVKIQPKPSPLAQPITAITASDTAVSDPPATRNALKRAAPPAAPVPSRRSPSASSDGSFTCDDIVISTVPRMQHAPSDTSAPTRSRPCGHASGRGTSGAALCLMSPTGGSDPAQRELGAGQHQAEHQRLVVDAGDQVHEQQRVGRAQPQRADLGDAAAPRQPRRGPHDQPDAEPARPGDDTAPRRRCSRRSAPRCRGRSTGTAVRTAPASPATGSAPTA